MQELKINEDYDNGAIAIMDVELAKTLASFEHWSWGGDIALRMSNGGLSVQGVDPAHVTMRYLDFPESEALQILQPVDVLINTKHLKHLVKGIRKGLIAIGYDNKNGVLVLCAAHHIITFPEIDSKGYNESKEPKMSLPNQYNVPGKPFLETFKLLKRWGIHFDFLEISGNINELRLITRHDTDEPHTQYSCRLSTECLKANIGTVTSLFTQDLLRNALEVLKATTLSLELGMDYPMILSTEKFGGVDRVLIAPRIDQR